MVCAPHVIRLGRTSIGPGCGRCQPSWARDMFGATSHLHRSWRLDSPAAWNIHVERRLPPTTVHSLQATLFNSKIRIHRPKYTLRYSGIPAGVRDPRYLRPRDPDRTLPPAFACLPPVRFKSQVAMYRFCSASSLCFPRRLLTNFTT